MTVLWQPSTIQQKNNQLSKFKAFIEEKYHIQFENYQALWQWSVSQAESFWLEIWHFFSVLHHKKPTKIFKKTGEAFYQVQWFEGAQLNFAENLLRGKPNNIALSFINEQGQLTQLNYQTLKIQVARLANRLRELDIQKGDRVAALMPNCPQTVIAMLATASIGAIWSACSPDFGLQGVLERFGQIQPKILFTINGYQYNGKTHSCLATVEQLAQHLPDIKQIIITPFIAQDIPIKKIVKATLFDDFLSDNNQLIFEPLPFNHPLCILYSSGTTGTPKCIVHSAGGTLLQHLKELALHSNVSQQQTIFFFTTASWMMWNWLISSLALGAHVVLYDGCPSYPQPTRLFDIVEKLDVSIFGCGAKYLDMLEKSSCSLSQTHNLGKLKTILSTGSPLSPHSFDYVYQLIKSDVQLSSISGGTDILSCFALGNPTLAVHRGELQCLGLGMDVAVYNEQGKPITQQKGELVCKSPFPSMPIYFWNDPQQKKYRAAYFERFTDCWAHGDYAELTIHNGLIIYGRSDAVLNPGGVRIGTAEIYRQVEKIPQVIDSVVIGQPWQGDERIVLFVQLQDLLILDDKLILSIQQFIKKNTTPRHVPAKILQVNAIPKTITGKVVELAVKKTVCGEAVTNIDALANPKALEQFKNRSELQ